MKVNNIQPSIQSRNFCISDRWFLNSVWTIHDGINCVFHSKTKWGTTCWQLSWWTSLSTHEGRLLKAFRSSYIPLILLVYRKETFSKKLFFFIKKKISVSFFCHDTYGLLIISFWMMLPSLSLSSGPLRTMRVIKITSDKKKLAAGIEAKD